MAKTNTACIQNAAFHSLWMTFPSQCNKSKFPKFILLFAKTQALHCYYDAQNDIKWLYLPASNLFSSQLAVLFEGWCSHRTSAYISFPTAQCVILLIIFFSSQAIVWSFLANYFLLLLLYLHCSRMGICTTSYTTLGLFCYLLGFHFVILLSLQLPTTSNCNL